GRVALLAIESLQLRTHVVHSLRQHSEFVAIGDLDARAEIAGRHLVEKALRLAYREDERPGYDEAAEQGEDYRDHRERAGQNQRALVGGGDAVAQPGHPVLLRSQPEADPRGDLGIEPL